MKLGIIDVGGGMRGAYASGVLDKVMDLNIHFDLGIGVSAGSGNMAWLVSKQRGNGHIFYDQYVYRKEYISLGNYFRCGSYVNLDYPYSTLINSDGEAPFDYQSFKENPMEFYVVATNALTGEPKYFTKDNVSQDNYHIMKASSSIPMVNKPYIIDGVPYFDGALSDSIPVKKAFELGCDKVVLILTKPEDTIRNSKKDEKLASFVKRKYPVAARKLCDRAKLYNEGVAYAKELAKEGKVLIVAPKDTFGVDTLKKDKVAVEKLYQSGYADGDKVLEFIKE